MASRERGFLDIATMSPYNHALDAGGISAGQWLRKLATLPRQNSATQVSHKNNAEIPHYTKYTLESAGITASVQGDRTSLPACPPLILGGEEIPFLFSDRNYLSFFSIYPLRLS